VTLQLQKNPDPIRHLSPQSVSGTVLGMYRFARLLQIAGLTIPPLSIIAQLSNTISLGQMLGFLVVSVCMFSLGYLLQAYFGGGSA
jgi:hypothetical protein